VDLTVAVETNCQPILKTEAKEGDLLVSDMLAHIIPEGTAGGDVEGLGRERVTSEIVDGPN
jgi:hypothetical protein